ncbi:hypothetical protein H2248_001151 [Termitomyces sp. 'cryptogamus']|nr:hypothetical protein H2248_001151 [Termitomyces sp. 'cryptogamus']
MHSLLKLFAVSPLIISSIVGQTVYLAGDSTMAKGGGGNGTDGWGQYLGQYLTIPVVNRAVAGRSARSYTDEERFDSLTNEVQSGDYVIIEFGHNDGLSGAVDNGRQDAFGDGYDTTATVTEADGTTQVIHTFTYYLQNAITALQAKGAIPIVSSQTPDNIWNGNVIAAGPRFVGYAQLVGQRTSAAYVDHYDYVAQAYNAYGQTTVTTWYPLDHTHTSPTGANVVAQAFIRGLLCGNSVLKSKVNAAGQTVPNDCL